MKLLLFLVLVIYVVVLTLSSVDGRGGGTTNGVEDPKFVGLFKRAPEQMKQLDPEEAKHWRRLHNLALLTQRFVKCLLLGRTPCPRNETTSEFRVRRSALEERLVANEPPPPPKQFRQRRQAPPGLPPPPDGMPAPPQFII